MNTLIAERWNKHGQVAYARLDCQGEGLAAICKRRSGYVLRVGPDAYELAPVETYPAALDLLRRHYTIDDFGDDVEAALPSKRVTLRTHRTGR